MEKKNPALGRIIRCICFSLGALGLIALYAWRISNIVEENQGMDGKSYDEMIEDYFSPSGISGWEGIAEEIAVNTGRAFEDGITTQIKVVWDEEEYQYYGYYEKDSHSETGTVYKGLRMVRRIDDSHNAGFEELVILSQYGEKEVEVLASFPDEYESYIIGYEDGAYVPNFRMEKDIKMSEKEIIALNEESREVLEQLLLERDYSRQQDTGEMRNSTICFGILLVVWTFMMIPFFQRKKPVEEGK